MFRHSTLAGFGLLAVCAITGCSHFLESRVIGKFTEALQQEDLQALKSRTSGHFERKALRLAEALDDLKILRLPDEKPTVVKVEDVSDNEKNVTVRVGDSKQRLLYRLIRTPDSDEWVVDDIYMKQKKQGVTAVKSVTEQMDLLLSLREFLAAWQEGGRSDVLRVTTPRFGRLLSKLPPAYLAHLMREVVGPNRSRSKFRPEAQLDEDVAIVRLPSPSGEFVISFRLQAGAWKVDDIAVESTDEEQHIPSVAKRAAIIYTALAFLDAYHAGDKSTLSKLCDARFAEGLLPADLGAVSLPDPDGPVPDYRVKFLGDDASFVLPAADGIVKIALVRSEGSNDLDETAEFFVEDVTIYEADGGNEKRLSALFTAHAVMQLFAESLSKRNLPMLRQLSTPDFSQRIWQRLDDTALRRLPLDEITGGPPQPVGAKYRGTVTEITVTQGAATVTYVLRDWNGKLRVDDIWVPIPGRPTSLKTSLELTLPIHQFADGLRTEQLALLERYSSADFKRLVWKQVQRFPDVGVAVLQLLQSPVDSVDLSADEATVQLGSERAGARVQLVREMQQWVVDDVQLMLGPEPSARHQLKHELRMVLAQEFRNLARPEPPSGRAGYDRPVPPPEELDEPPPFAADGPSPFEEVEPEPVEFAPRQFDASRSGRFLE